MLTLILNTAKLKEDVKSYQESRSTRSIDFKEITLVKETTSRDG
ncbi:hypothetical protein [Dubosiella newyorkensis]